MRTVWYVTAVSVASGTLVATLVVPDVALEVLLGMAGPLAVSVGSLVLVDRTYRRDPGRVTRLMIRAFVGKLVAFGVYVAVAVSVLSLDAIPFVASFTIYFVALHLAEAAHLQRLFTG